jgi:hypothetical protein
MEKSGVFLLVVGVGTFWACEKELVDGGFDLVQGALRIVAPPKPAAASHAFVPFTPPAEGTVDVSIDWDPRPNRVSFTVSEGACSASPCPAEIDMGPFVDGAQNKPISGSSTLSPRLHTLRIDNWGPDVVSATYVVRFRPR